MGGLLEDAALLGELQPAGVAVEERDPELRLERGDLARDRRLGALELLAGRGQAAGVGDGVKYPELVPVHVASSPWRISPTGRYDGNA